MAGTVIASIKTNNADPIDNIPVAVPQGTKVGEVFTAGDLVGIVKSAPVKGEDGQFWSTLGLRVEVGVDGIAGTATLGAKLYVTTANILTLTASTNRQIGVLTRAKPATGDRLWAIILPSLGLAAAA